MEAGRSSSEQVLLVLVDSFFEGVSFSFETGARRLILSVLEGLELVELSVCRLFLYVRDLVQIEGAVVIALGNVD